MKNWHYVILALVISVLIFLFAVWLPNLSFVREITTSQYFGISEKIGILFGSLKAFQTNMMPFSRIILVALSLLFGLNMSLFAFYIRSRVRLQKEAGLSVGGIIAGIVGIGCASCGSFILASLFGMSASVAFLSLLPFGGHEFGILSIVILGYSIISISKKIQEPLVCR